MNYADPRYGPTRSADDDVRSEQPLTAADPESPGDAAVATPSKLELPDWLPPRWPIVGIFLILAISAIASARDFLMPVILAFLLTLVFTPLRRILNRWGIPPAVCALLIIVGLLGGIGAGVMVLSGPVNDWVERAPQLGPQIEGKLRALRQPVEGIAEAGAKIDEIADGADEPGTQTVEVKQDGFTTRVANTMPTIAAQTGFVLVLLFFLISSGDMFYEKLVHVMPTFTDKRKALRIVFDIERRLARYLSTIALINAGLGCAVGLAMWLIGMPTPQLFGLLAFVLNFIPYVGAVVGVATATVIGLVTFPDPWSALIPGLVYFTLTSIEGQLITPYFVGRTLRLNTVIVFVSIAFWAWMWSIVGMIIAVPMLVVIRVLCEHVNALEPIGDFLSSRGAEFEDDEEEGAPVTPAGGPAP